MCCRILPVWCALLLSAAVLAQAPLNQPAPLARAPTGASPGTGALALAAAQRAQELGLASLAAAEYRKLLDAPGADRAGLTLALAAALLDAGNAAEAESALNAFVGLRGAAWQLRAGLAAAQLRKSEAAKAALAAAKFEELGAADQAWWHFLAGLVADAAGDVPRANEAYQKAEQAAPTVLARARFLLAHERARMQRVGTVDEVQLRQARANYERFQGSATGYDFARTLAVMLVAAKQRDQAVALLQRSLLTLPAEERGWADDFRLLLGLIADPARELAARTALTQLLETGRDRDKQRMALQLLANAAQGDAARGAFRAELDKLIGAPTPHPIQESLLLFRAQTALFDRNSEGYARAEADANRLLNEFPGSALRVQAFGLLTVSAWEQRRYRTAADGAQKARAELANAVRPEDLAARAKLGVLEAEARFRAGESAGDAGDYRRAADAYAAALRERPADVKPGELMFQRVLAEIRAGTPAAAEPLLDVLARDPAFDLENRWQAEWNLARALQADEKTAVAYARVNRLLATAPTGAAELKPELRARMAWLQARLSLEAGQPKETIELAGKLAASLGGLEPALRDDILSSAALVTAEASFKLGDEAAALKALQRVRTDFKKSDAAVYSYIIEANHFAALDKAAEAQQLLKKLADEFPENSYAPYALFQAALQSERLGQDKNYEEANAIIERMVTKYPGSGLVFAARLKQGDLLRKLNYFPQAQRVYYDLVTRFPHHGDVIYAKLALAECINAQGTSSATLLADAQARFEELHERVDAPVDVRVEAGYNLGMLLARRGDAAKALAVWWRGVAFQFLLDDPARAAQLGPTGRHWMTRTLLEAGALLEKQEKLEEAKRAWRLILEAKLPGESLAREKLRRFEGAEGTP